MSPDPRAVERIERLYREHGHIPDAPDGPIISQFDPMALANAIESEVSRAEKANGRCSKVSLHMDPRDALELARRLRQLALLWGGG